MAQLLAGPRRCGWFDAVTVKRIIKSNNVSALCLTKIDVLDFLDTIKICVDYSYKDGSKNYAECMDLDAVEPKYIECKGWKTPLKGINRSEDLPLEAIEFIKKIEEVCELPVDIISTGPDDMGTILINKDI